MWYLNRKYSAREALAMGLVNEVVDDGSVLERPVGIARELRRRGPFALPSLKTAFAGRHSGVAVQARLAHDLLLTAYHGTQEAEEMSQSFEQRREPDRTRFYR